MRTMRGGGDFLMTGAIRTVAGNRDTHMTIPDPRGSGDFPMTGATRTVAGNCECQEVNPHTFHNLERPMLVRPHRFLLALLAVVLFLGLSSARANDAEAVKEKLFQAKKEYDGEVSKYKKAVGEWLDKHEDEARKAGNKKLVDQYKAERDAFEKNGDPPQPIPDALVDAMRAVRLKLDMAYTAVFKDYLVLKKDEAADAIDKEQQEFRLSSALQFGKRYYLGKMKSFDVRVHLDIKKEYVFEKDASRFKLNGELMPHSLYTLPDEKGGGASVSYTLGGRMLAFQTTVGIPTYYNTQQDPASPVVFEVLGDNKTLWKSEPITKRDSFQTCKLNVEKVKTLTLRVHCKVFNWAHAIWFSPYLVD